MKMMSSPSISDVLHFGPVHTFAIEECLDGLLNSLQTLY